MMRRDEVLQTLAKHRSNELVITTMSVAQEWPAYSQSEFDFNALGTGMGHLPDMGLGLAAACPDRKVLILNGDGSMLMNLGVLVSIANVAPRNLILFVFENEIYLVAGGTRARLAPGVKSKPQGVDLGYHGPPAIYGDSVLTVRSSEYSPPQIETQWRQMATPSGSWRLNASKNRRTTSLGSVDIVVSLLCGSPRTCLMAEPEA